MTEATTEGPTNIIWANKTALSLGAVASVVLIIIPATIWFATLATKLDEIKTQQDTMWTRMDAMNQQHVADANRLTSLETIIPVIKDQLTEIKASVSKIETRVVK